MGLVLFVLLVALLLGGFGFAVHALWILFVVVALFWAIGFLARVPGRRWWYW